LLFSTERAIYRSVNGGVNGVNRLSPLPESVFLRSYPNPVSAGSVISLEIELAGTRERKAVITLYDIMGRKVKTFLEDAVAPGKTTVSLPTAGLSPGIYFVRFTAENSVNVRKVVVQ
ncbi:MAG: T9SS type A sorting domain-containing protein, partial [Chlorobi bacterium]|nr:T9SS type A sorting domain-containing protein [Chlorobiota bacterium]